MRINVIGKPKRGWTHVAVIKKMPCSKCGKKWDYALFMDVSPEAILDDISLKEEGRALFKDFEEDKPKLICPVCSRL